MKASQTRLVGAIERGRGRKEALTKKRAKREEEVCGYHRG